MNNLDYFLWKWEEVWKSEINSFIEKVKNILVYSKSIWKWGFGVAYKKDDLVIKEWLWNSNRVEYEYFYDTVDEWLSVLNEKFKFEYEVLRYIKDSNISTSTPKPVLFIENKEIEDILTNMDKFILFLKCFSKDEKYRDIINLFWTNFILKNILKWNILKEYIKNFFTINTLTRPVIVMEKMNWNPIDNIKEEKEILIRYNVCLEELKEIWISHDKNYWNILYDTKKDVLNLVDFWDSEIIIDKMNEIISINSENFREKYPFIYEHVQKYIK